MRDELVGGRVRYAPKGVPIPFRGKVGIKGVIAGTFLNPGPWLLVDWEKGGRWDCPLEDVEFQGNG